MSKPLHNGHNNTRPSACGFMAKLIEEESARIAKKRADKIPLTTCERIHYFTHDIAKDKREERGADKGYSLEHGQIYPEKDTAQKTRTKSKDKNGKELQVRDCVIHAVTFRQFNRTKPVKRKTGKNTMGLCPTVKPVNNFSARRDVSHFFSYR